MRRVTSLRMGLPSSLHVVLVKPADNPHAEGLREVAEVLCFGAQRLGIDARVVESQIDPSIPSLVVGWHLLNDEALRTLPPRAIVYNLEQLDLLNAGLLARLVEISARTEIWDYSLKNLRILRRTGATGVLRRLPVGYAQELSRIVSAPNPDVDVLFYGSGNLRRSLVVKALQSRSLKVMRLFGVYGAERDAWIARSKLILNIHYFESSIFEVVRVSYLLANRKAVVAEGHGATEVDADLAGAVSLAPYDQLVERCVELAGDGAARRALEERGFQAMRARDQANFLRSAFDGEPEPMSYPEEAPTRVLGTPKVYFHHPRWSAAGWHLVVATYCARFGAHDEVELVLWLDPSQGVSAASAWQGIHGAQRAAGRDPRSSPRITLLSEPYDARDLARLYASAHVIVTGGDPVLGERARSVGRPTLEDFR
jgi:hypothetical protein